MACHRQTAMLVGLFLAVGLIGGCSSSKPAPTEAAAASAAAQGGPIVDISSYKLGPGDALRVTGTDDAALRRQLPPAEWAPVALRGLGRRRRRG